MFYEYHLTVPPNTPASLPLSQYIDLAPGRIVMMAVGLPRGCVGLVHAQILESLYVHWPSNPDGDISGDDVVVQWAEAFDLDPTHPRLRLRAWNLDDSVAHTVTFRINVIEKATIDRMEMGMTALDYLARWYAQHPST